MKNGTVQRGLTLIELLIVLVLLSVMTSAVVVSLRGRDQVHALKLATADLQTAIETAWRESRLTGSRHRVVFLDYSPTKGGFRSYLVEVATGAGTHDVAPAPGLAGTRHVLGEQLHLTGVSDDGGSWALPPEAIEFSSEGQDFSGVLRLQTNQGSSACIRVIGTTGQTQAWEVLP